MLFSSAKTGPKTKTAEKNHYQTTPRPASSDKKRCKTLEEPMLRRAQAKADNLPTNPSSGETARVGWRAASPYKRPSNPENQTVVVIKSFLGQGYKHPGHPAALSLDPYLRRLPAGDGKGGTGQEKGQQGPGGLQAGRPGFPNLILQR